MQKGLDKGRRNALLTLGAGGVALLIGKPWKTAVANETPSAPACVITPEQTEGPYFVDEMLNRTDIRTDSTDGSSVVGIPLVLSLCLSAINGTDCKPLPNAVVDVWHCDSNGVYSDVRDRSFDTTGKTFLRGYQVTDTNGKVTFTTIYPGWYWGRTVHIHFKVRADTGGGKVKIFTSQLYFDDAFTDTVYSLPPYNNRGERSTRNEQDGIFRNGGQNLLLKLAGDANGYTASLDIGVDMG